MKPTVPPQAAVQTVLDGLKASKPAAFWDVLADDRQVAINKAVRDLADAMDPDVWDINALAKTIDVGKITAVDAKRKMVILELPNAAAEGKSTAHADAPQTSAAK